MARAREDAEGTELFELPEGGSLELEREIAQGVEVFEDPDATRPGTMLREGSPGHEVLTGEGLGVGGDDEADHRADEEQG
jgi:hypothetical protein